MLDDKYSDNKLAQSFSNTKDVAKRFFLSGIAITLISFLTLMLPSTSLKYGELKKTLYQLDIEYTETQGAQADLTNMSSVQAGILYQIDVKD